MNEEQERATELWRWFTLVDFDLRDQPVTPAQFAALHRTIERLWQIRQGRAHARPGELDSYRAVLDRFGNGKYGGTR